MRISLFLVFVLALSGCANPSFIPTGYKYHHDIYKSAPGPEAPAIGYAYSEGANEEVLQIWRIAVKDLLDMLQERTGMVPQAVYVVPADQQSAFNTTYDHMLREQLRERGYVLVSSPSQAVSLNYAAEKQKPDTSGEYTGDLNDYLLKIDLTQGGALLGHASGIYKLPGYGYKAPRGIHRKQKQAAHSSAAFAAPAQEQVVVAPAPASSPVSSAQPVAAAQPVVVEQPEVYRETLDLPVPLVQSQPRSQGAAVEQLTNDGFAPPPPQRHLDNIASDLVPIGGN